MDTASQWPLKDMASTKPMEEMMLQSSKPNSSSPAERRATRPHKEPGGSFICPRCNSTNTKFCYYNNYSLSQPRFFCKACRRYWTQGGSLRNIPVGGASRKSSTKPSSSSSTSTDHNSSKKLQLPRQNPSKAEDLNLGFSIPDAGYKSFADMMPAFQNPSSSLSSGVLYNNYAFLPVVGSGFHGGLPEIGKSSSLSFTLDGHGGSYGGFQGVEENNHHNSRDDNGNGNENNKILFPFEDLKQDSNTDRDDADQQNGFWNGVLGGGSW